MSSAAVVISSALRFIYKQTTFRNIFSYFSQKKGSDIRCKFSPIRDNLHAISNHPFWEK